MPQVVGSNVLVYTTGTAPMTFTLSFPPRDSVLKDPTCYVVKPAYQMRCGAGTLSVLDAVDDLILTHGADFELLDGDETSWRVGWTWRWLQADEEFYDDTGGLRLSAERLEKLKDMPRADVLFPREVPEPGHRSSR